MSFGIGEGFDVVVGNPPYLFLSGKGSPVQLLKKSGNIKEANALQSLYNSISNQLPSSSKGCRDLYKWFIDKAVHLTKPKGLISYIVPNTFITLKNYQDVRNILFTQNTTGILLDLGFDMFEAPIVPSAVFQIRKTTCISKTILYSDLKEVDRNKLLSTSLSSIISDNKQQITTKGTELLLYKHPIAERIYAQSQTSLRHWVKLSEGEHNMKLDQKKIRQNPLSRYIPALLDSVMQRYSSVPLVYIPKCDCVSFDKKLHSGERLLIRKTGDKIVVARPSTFETAVAHQNVYVAHPMMPDIGVYVLMALLNSKLLTFLYQNGIYGQKSRTMAQFRIYAMYLLPMPNILSKDIQSLKSLSENLVAEKCRNSEANTSKLEAEVDSIVYKIYKVSSKEEVAIIEAATAPKKNKESSGEDSHSEQPHELAKPKAARSKKRDQSKKSDGVDV